VASDCITPAMNHLNTFHGTDNRLTPALRWVICVSLYRQTQVGEALWRTPNSAYSSITSPIFKIRHETPAVPSLSVRLLSCPTGHRLGLRGLRCIYFITDQFSPSRMGHCMSHVRLFTLLTQKLRTVHFLLEPEPIQPTLHNLIVV
jgi:hypothetical protein